MRLAPLGPIFGIKRFRVDGLIDLERRLAEIAATQIETVHTPNLEAPGLLFPRRLQYRGPAEWARSVMAARVFPCLDRRNPLPFVMAAGRGLWQRLLHWPKKVR